MWRVKIRKERSLVDLAEPVTRSRIKKESSLAARSRQPISEKSHRKTISEVLGKESSQAA
jgi:hypothetical protein